MALTTGSKMHTSLNDDAGKHGTAKFSSCYFTCSLDWRVNPLGRDIHRVREVRQGSHSEDTRSALTLHDPDFAEIALGRDDGAVCDGKCLRIGESNPSSILSIFNMCPRQTDLRHGQA